MGGSAVRTRIGNQALSVPQLVQKTQLLNNYMQQKDSPIKQAYAEGLKNMFPGLELDRVQNIQSTPNGIQFIYEDGTGYWWEEPKVQ